MTGIPRKMDKAGSTFVCVCVNVHTEKKQRIDRNIESDKLNSYASRSASLIKVVQTSTLSQFPKVLHMHYKQ